MGLSEEGPMMRTKGAVVSPTRNSGSGRQTWPTPGKRVVTDDQMRRHLVEDDHELGSRERIKRIWREAQLEGR